MPEYGSNGGREWAGYPVFVPPNDQREFLRASVIFTRMDVGPLNGALVSFFLPSMCFVYICVFDSSDSLLVMFNWGKKCRWSWASK